VTVKAVQTVGDTDPRAEDEGGAMGLKEKVAIGFADELAESPT